MSEINLTGERFGRLVVQIRANAKGERSRWLCRCDCGNQKSVLTCHLRMGRIVSCGCLKGEKTAARNVASAKHGMYLSDEYRIWQCMLRRCDNAKSSEKFALYGGRGIVVCAEWRQSFQAFLQHVGFRPSKRHSIDRFPDKNGNYEPGNVRWATIEQQLSNRRNTVYTEFEGEVIAATELARRYGMNPRVVSQRVQAGWSGRDLLKPRQPGRAP